MNIIDNIEKINGPNKIVNIDKDPSVLLVVTYNNDEQELFTMDAEAAIETVESLYYSLSRGEKTIHIVHNNPEIPSSGDIVGPVENLKDFRGLIRIDDSIRAIRIITHEDLEQEGEPLK